LEQLLKANADNYTWVAATTGSNDAATYQLATGDAVMPIGGFSGGDPSPTLTQFQQYVAQGRIHYYILALRPGGPGGPGGSQTEAAKIAEWVKHNFTDATVDGATYYDLTAPQRNTA
jgi:hypothetical protein